MSTDDENKTKATQERKRASIDRAKLTTFGRLAFTRLDAWNSAETSENAGC